MENYHLLSSLSNDKKQDDKKGDDDHHRHEQHRDVVPTHVLAPLRLKRLWPLWHQLIVERLMASSPLGCAPLSKSQRAICVL